MSVLIVRRQCPLWGKHGVDRYVFEGSRRVRIAGVSVVFRQVQRLLGAVLEQLPECGEWQVRQDKKKPVQFEEGVADR